jgi:hypothetical protein
MNKEKDVAVYALELLGALILGAIGSLLSFARNKQ